jgi:hypothetical protein
VHSLDKLNTACDIRSVCGAHGLKPRTKHCLVLHGPIGLSPAGKGLRGEAGGYKFASTTPFLWIRPPCHPS